jgi:hypothetical protein
MSDLQLTLTQAERDWLVGLFENLLKEKRIEEHRTRTPTFRERVLQEEDMIKSILGKLGQPAA